MKTYEEIMRERLNDGKGPRRIEEEISPGVKNLLVGKKRTVADNPGKVSASAPASVPGVNKLPAVLKDKDIHNNNYMANMYKDEKAGNYSGAKYNEMMHNVKNDYLGLGYADSYIYNYDDPYKNDLERQRLAIENRDPFSYDYLEDDVYQSIRAQKKKDAQKAYNDAYAQLSTQFDGDIPVNMITKLMSTKADIEDQADSYIPTLRQMAYQMYMNEGDRMYQNYGLTRDADAERYARHLTERDFQINSLENEYNRNLAKEQLDYTKAIDDRNFEYAKAVDDRNFEYTKEQNDKNALDTRFEKARALYATGLYSSFDEAYMAAGKY